MPIFRDDYLRNIDEPIAAQKRVEADQGEGFRNALILAGTVAGFVLMRKKIALTRSISQELQALGRAGKVHEKYIVRRAVEAATRKAAGVKIKAPRRWVSTWARWGEEIGKPLPALREEYNIAHMALQQRFPKIALSKLPTFEETGLRESAGWLGRVWKGPSVAAIAPEATAGMSGLTTGQFGGLYAGGSFYKLGVTGEVEQIFKNVRVGITTFEGRLEAARLGLYEGTEWTNVKDFTRNVLLPRRAVLEREEQWSRLRKYLDELGVATNESSTLGDLKKAADQFIARRPDLKNILTPTKLFEGQAGPISDSVDDAVRVLLDKELAKKSTHLAYKTYRAQVSLGIGEMYARAEAGGPQRVERLVRELGSFGTRHPVTERLLQTDPRTYVRPGVSIAGFWRGNTPGTTFLYPASGTLKRATTSILEGTFFGIPEEMLGIGITTRATRLTNFMSKVLGAEAGSYGGYAIRNVGRYARIGAAGFGAYYSFRFINYLARQATGGWGMTDVAGKMYTGGREFQQNLLDQVGVVDTMRKTEKAFPGAVKSPLAHSIRATSPLWMAYIGKRMGGAKWGRIGLALGLATALITWGDITQDPKELHRIFTGEQDIPVRKGRYWPFGRTPLFGGRIMYWRPHWYPLMRSKYKFRGQLWDSETEYWAQGTPLSPILAPFLEGRLWDPNYWEKKHYYDRPYPLTSELFEPTMPFAWLGNLTLGQLIKPQRMMHPEVWGTPQPEATKTRGMVTGAGTSLGIGVHTPGGIFPAISPDDPTWQASMGLYTLTEQMGLRGFMSQQFMESLTGRPDFLPEGPIIQSARRATGYERGYWDMNIGDPFGVTEFFRRVLPHRRRAIEEWNPIKNTMPEWLPGQEYYKDFQHGDPYTKIEMGEARLPGPGYESLHRLHSGIPNVYDAIDRFLILADIAPYSDQYKQYRALATMMSRDDKYWSERVKKKISQRSLAQQEYDFLELEPPEDVTGPLRGLSVAYRHGIAGVTNFASLLEAGPLTPVSKLFPYKTAMGTYKDYRIYGDEFTSWGHPIRDFVAPWMNKVRGRAADLFGMEYIPGGEEERRDYEEYFDKLKYTKYNHLARLAGEQGNANLRKKLESVAKQTMTGVNIYGGWVNMYRSMPKRERSFYQAFVDARREDREEILDMVPLAMQRLYKAQWNIADKKAGLERSFDTDNTAARDTVDFFKTHHLPPADWAGWHPDISLRDVQLKVVKQEAMDIHNFNLWESQERAMRRRPYVPTIESIYDPTVDLSVLQNTLQGELQNQGFSDSRIFITRTPAIRNLLKMNFKVRRKRTKQYDESMRDYIYA